MLLCENSCGLQNKLRKALLFITKYLNGPSDQGGRCKMIRTRLKIVSVSKLQKLLSLIAIIVNLPIAAKTAIINPCTNDTATLRHLYLFAPAYFTGIGMKLSLFSD